MDTPVGEPDRQFKRSTYIEGRALLGIKRMP